MKKDILHPVAMKFTSEKQMPYSTLSLATMEWNETGTWRYLKPRYVERIPACQHSCPTSNDIESWIRLFEKGKFEEAWEAATMENPFPAIMGRVCFHPCMDGCNRRELGGSVNINMLERALGDAMPSGSHVPKAFFPSSKKSVAIIGSGPAGLSCAWHLSRLGHGVVVFERSPKAGGMLRYGIPSYRLPKDVLDKEIDRLKKMGVRFELEKPIRDAEHTEALRKEFDAVFIASGAAKSKPVGMADEKAAGVMTGLEFLKIAAEGRPSQLGQKAIVIGGGNTALDAARTARRFGADVTIVYRRSRAEMPAFGEEIEQALNEGVKIEILAGPSRVILKDGRARGLECGRMKLGEPDESGRRSPVPSGAPNVTFDADTILCAIGEDVDPSIIPAALSIDDGSLKTRPGGSTELGNVFAGGDLIEQPRTVVNALGAGKRGAIAIDCLLRGEKFEEIFGKIRVADTEAVSMSRYAALRAGKRPRTATTSEIEILNKVVEFGDINTAYFDSSSPAEYPKRGVKERLEGTGFAEVHMAPAEETRRAELARCFHCGRCTECDNCFIYCPDVSIAKKDGGFEIDPYFCKGCGVCSKECPRAAMDMTEE